MNRPQLAAEIEPEATHQVSGPEQADGIRSTGTDSALLRVQRSHGNHYVQRLLAVPAVQARLRLGPVGDRYEQEADRLGQELSEGARMLSPASIGSHAGAIGGVVDPAVQQLILSARGLGQSLPVSVRQDYERGLDTDLAAVRVHTDHRADALNLRLRSDACTAGTDIFFRRGEYDPTTEAGREILAHELVHVVQQGADADGGTLIQRGPKRPARRGKTSIPKRKKNTATKITLTLTPTTKRSRRSGRGRPGPSGRRPSPALTKAPRPKASRPMSRRRSRRGRPGPSVRRPRISRRPSISRISRRPRISRKPTRPARSRSSTAHWTR